MASHEEPYLPGAWEKFNESTTREKTPVFTLFRVLSIAAMLLVCAFVFLYVNRVDEKPTQQLAGQKSGALPQQDEAVDTEPDSEILDETALIPELERSIYTVKRRSQEEVIDSMLNDGTAQKYAYRALDSTALLEQQAALLAPAENIPLESMIASRKMQLKGMLPLRSKVPVPTISAMPEEGQAAEPARSFEDFLKHEQVLATAKQPMQDKKAMEDKWALGLVVAPSIGNNNKLNLGYGLSMGYALSKKVAVVSGISYNDMHASNQVPAPPMNTAAFFQGESKNLESVEASVSGIDIPLGIKYNLSKRVYANVGVSAFAVLNERKNNTYVQERSVQTASTDPASAGEMRIVVMNQRVTEKAPDPSVGDKYIGFYNLSFGVQQPLSKKNTLSLEPFVRLPMKETSADNLKLIGTGIKVKLDF